MDFEETEARNVCAGKGQQQFNRPTERMTLQLAVGRQTRWRSPQTVASDGNVESGAAPIVSRCVATPSLLRNKRQPARTGAMEHRS
jgi:hypothetical protein